MQVDKSSIRELKDIQEPLFVFKHLKTDLDILKSQINNLKNTKISTKMLRGINLKKSDVVDTKILEFTGSRLSQRLKNIRAKEVSAKLKKHPDDSKSRLELVDMFLQEENHRSIENARDAFLLAMLEVESPMISTQKINIALVAQTVYLTKLQKFLQDDLSETVSKIKGDGNVDTILEKQEEKLQGEFYVYIGLQYAIENTATLRNKLGIP